MARTSSRSAASSRSRVAARRAARAEEGEGALVGRGAGIGEGEGHVEVRRRVGESPRFGLEFAEQPMGGEQGERLAGRVGVRERPVGVLDARPASPMAR